MARKTLDWATINGEIVRLDDFEDSKFDGRALCGSGIPGEIVSKIEDLYHNGGREDRDRIEGLCRRAREGEIDKKTVIKLKASYFDMKKAIRDFGKTCYENGRNGGSCY